MTNRGNFLNKNILTITTRIFLKSTNRLNNINRIYKILNS